MEAHRRQPGMLEGLSRFLVQHERCGAGFDVAHPAGLGSGRVSITCRGCGARHEYATATIEVEREQKVGPAEPPRPPERAPVPEPESPAPIPRERSPHIPATPPPYPESTRRSAQRRAAQTAGRPGVRIPHPPAESAIRRIWRSPRTTPVLVVVAAVALGLGVVRLLNDNRRPDNPPTEPLPSPPPSATPSPVPETAAPPGIPAPARSPTVTLRTNRFTIEIPRGWTERSAGGGLLVEPRGGGRVNVQIFFERSPGLSAAQMARQTRDFIGRQVPGARLFANRIDIAGQRAYELTARGPGETAIAVNVLRGPHRYLLVRRIFAGAKPQTSQAAGRIVLSFRPR